MKQAVPAYLLFSSGRRQRYLEDIFRALALPEGAEIRFRYREDLLSESAGRGFLEASGSIAYMCYLDISTEGVPPTFVPVRRAKIVRVEKRGTSYFVYMRAKEYVSTEAVVELTRLTMDELPGWGERDPSGRYNSTGYIVSRLEQDLPASCLAQAADRAAFERTVDELLTHQDFRNAENRFFFRVDGLKEFDQRHKIKDKSIVIKDGFWQLAANRRYRLEVSYLYPDEVWGTSRPKHWIGVRTAGIGATVDRSALQRSDSAYDVKFFHLSASNVPIGAYDDIQVFRTLDPDDSQTVSADISLGVRTRQGGLALTGKVLIVATAIALPVITAELAKGTSYWFAVVLVAAVISSFMALFGLKKPI